MSKLCGKFCDPLFPVVTGLELALKFTTALDGLTMDQLDLVCVTRPSLSQALIDWRIWAPCCADLVGHHVVSSI